MKTSSISLKKSTFSLIVERIGMILFLSVVVSTIIALVFAPFSHLFSVMTDTRKIFFFHNMPNWIRFVGFIGGSIGLFYLMEVDAKKQKAINDCESAGPILICGAGVIGEITCISVYFAYQVFFLFGNLWRQQEYISLASFTVIILTFIFLAIFLIKREKAIQLNE